MNDDNLRDTLSEIVLDASRILRNADCSIGLYDDQSREIVVMAASNRRLDDPRSRFPLGEGIAGTVAQMRQPLLVKDVRRDRRFLPRGDRTVRAVLSVPILRPGSRLLGVITAVSPRAGAFGADHERILRMLADLASLALAQANRVRVSHGINRFASCLLGTRGVSAAFSLLIESLSGLLPLDAAQMSVMREGRIERLEHSTQAGARLPPIPDELSRRLAQPRILSSPELSEIVGDALAPGSLQSFILVPLQLGEQYLGHVLIGSTRHDAYDGDQAETLGTFGSYLALWLTNHELTSVARSRRQQIEGVFTSSADAILMLNNDRVARLNPAGCRLLGRAEHECLGVPLDELVHLPERPEAAAPGPIRHKVNTTAGERYVEIRWSSAAVDSVPVSILTLKDITETLELDRAKANFISMVSHELRTPLNSIMGFSDILRSESAGPLTATQREFLDYVYHSAQHLRSLVSDILVLSSMDAGHFPLTHDQLLPGALARQVVNELSATAAQMEIDLSCHVASDLPTVYGDAVRIQQVCINLVDNALKFTPPGGSVHLAVRRDGEGILFSVSDTGPGIPPEDQPRVFERFFQSVSSPTAATKGSGLGLTIAQQLVELHGGRLWLESRMGQGATFFFSLPPRAPAVGPT